MKNVRDDQTAAEADITTDAASTEEGARANVTDDGGQPESPDAVAADRSGVVIGGAQGQQPPPEQSGEAQTAQTTGEPGTTQVDPKQRPNIRLRRTGTASVPTGQTIQIPKAGGAEGETDEVPEMKTVDVYADPLQPGKLSIGMSPVIEIPSKEAQRAGWYDERAQEIINLHPDRFIAVVEKGA